MSIHPVWVWAIAFLVIVVACSTPSPGSPTLSPSASVSPPSSLARLARIVEVTGSVKQRVTTSDEWRDAVVGQELAAGAQVQTFAASGARIDVSPSPVVRVGASTLFTVSNLSGSNDQPVTTLDLLSGKIWVILNTALNGGSFDVQTPVGVAAVRGSYLGVDFDDIVENMIASCLEGHCDARNKFGITDMTAEQETSIINADLPPLPATTMDPERLEKWREVVKEATLLIAPAETRMAPTWAAPNFENTRAAIQTLVPRPSATPNSTRPPNPATEQSIVLTRVFDPTAQPPTLSSGQFNRLTQMATSQPTLNPTRVSEILTRVATLDSRLATNRPPSKTPEPTNTPRLTELPKETEPAGKPTGVIKPTEETKPTEKVEPTNTPRPIGPPIRFTDTPKPTDPPRPTEIPKPTEPPRPSNTPRPIDPPRPTEIPKPTEPPRPSNTPRPIDPPNTPRPTDPPRPTDVPKPTNAPRPTDAPKPTDAPTAVRR